MKSATWYADQAAQAVHRRISKEMELIIAEMCPGHELSHMGINRNPETDEVILKLHLNPIGRVRVVGDPSPSDMVNLPWRTR